MKRNLFSRCEESSLCWTFASLRTDDDFIASLQTAPAACSVAGRHPINDKRRRQMPETLVDMALDSDSPDYSKYDFDPRDRIHLEARVRDEFTGDLDNV